MGMQSDLASTLGSTNGVFANAVKAKLLQMAGDVDQKVNYTVGEMLKRLVYRTPVGDPDTWGARWRAYRGVDKGMYEGGHARANWVVSVGAPTASDVAGTDETGAATIAKGLAQLRGAGHIYWLCNAAAYQGKPYIMDLEYGYSDQAPLGMARQTIAEFRTIFNAAGVSRVKT